MKKFTAQNKGVLLVFGVLVGGLVLAIGAVTQPARIASQAAYIPNPDLTPPTVTIISPGNRAVLKSNSNVSIAVNAADDIGVTKVEFYADNLLLCTQTSIPYICVWHVPSNLNSSYSLSAKAYDAAGNSSSAAVSVSTWK